MIFTAGDFLKLFYTLLIVLSISIIVGVGFGTYFYFVRVILLNVKKENEHKRNCKHEKLMIICQNCGTEMDL